MRLVMKATTELLVKLLAQMPIAVKTDAKKNKPI